MNTQFILALAQQSTETLSTIGLNKSLNVQQKSILASNNLFSVASLFLLKLSTIATALIMNKLQLSTERHLTIIQLQSDTGRDRSKLLLTQVQLARCSVPYLMSFQGLNGFYCCQLETLPQSELFLP